MSAPETYVLRHWRAVFYFGAGIAAVIVPSIVERVAIWPLAALPLTLLLIAWRQKVVLDTDGVELVNAFSRHRLRWQDIRALEVVYRRLPWQFGWSIRLHHAAGFRDTFQFMGVGFRVFGKVFASPPADAPAPIEDLYQAMVARLSTVQIGPDRCATFSVFPQVDLPDGV